MVMTMAIKTITASQFKAKCLALMDEVARNGEAIVITKHGKPVAQLTPPAGANGARKAAFGLHRGLVYPLGEVDLSAPVAKPADWTADEENLPR
jgi:prevent-host-death family protein